MAQYILRTGAVTALAATASIAGQGSQTSPGPILVPPGVSQIVQVMVVYGQVPLTTTGGLCAFVRIAGGGIVGTGEVDLPIGSTESVLTTSGAAATHTNAIIIPTAIPVTPGGLITLTSDNQGTGTPTGRAGIGLVFA